MPIFDPSRRAWLSQWSHYRQSSSTSDLDDDSEKHLLNSQPTPPKSNTLFMHLLFFLLHIVIAVLWTSSIYAFSPLCRPTPELLKPTELQGLASAIEYKKVWFDVSGGGTRENPITPYEGPPTPEKDMAWYELMNVGMIALTPEMNATLPHPTQPISNEDDTPLIQLDVFHQLHCLNAIRNIVYNTNPYYNPDDRQDQIHIDHCLDYLRQVLMCHADVTPITHKKRPAGYNPILPPWVPNFHVEHFCRDFGKIHEWARQYNTSAYVIESWPGLDPVAELRVGQLGHEGEHIHGGPVGH